jgi:signal transduction histidine kinase
LTLLHDEVAIFQRALETAADVLQYKAIGYGLVDETAGELVYRQRLVNGVLEPLASRLPLKGDRGIGAAVARSGQAINVPDISQDPRYVSLQAEPASRSELCVPMKVGERVIGVLNVESVELHSFTPADQQLLQTLANQTGVAVENARLYRSLQEQMQVLQETQAQLIHSEKMAALGRLVAAVAHEINNPLQAIQGGLSLIREELGGQSRPESLTRFLDLAEEGIARIAAIVGRVGDFYRPGRRERRPTDLHAVLEDVLELAGERLHQSDITVERAWADALPHVPANPDHLRQVFLTLVLNAVDAIGRGGTLRISTGLDQPGEEMVRIAFSDTGVGMSPEVQARLFEPFFTTKTYASGLGLPISYQVVEGHGGQIAVTSEEGVGTTFIILLPVAPVTDDAADLLAGRVALSRPRSVGDG